MQAKYKSAQSSAKRWRGNYVEQLPFDYIFTTQMAALYDKTAYDGKDQRTGSQVCWGKKVGLTVASLPPQSSTRFEVWQSISGGGVADPGGAGHHIPLFPS